MRDKSFRRGGDTAKSYTCYLSWHSRDFTQWLHQTLFLCSERIFSRITDYNDCIFLVIELPRIDVLVKLFYLNHGWGADAVCFPYATKSAGKDYKLTICVIYYFDSIPSTETGHFYLR